MIPFFCDMVFIFYFYNFLVFEFGILPCTSMLLGFVVHLFLAASGSQNTIQEIHDLLILSIFYLCEYRNP